MNWTYVVLRTLRKHLMGSTWTYWTECLSIVKLFDIIKCNSSCILCSFMLFNIHGLRPPLISPWKWRGCSDYPYCLIVPSFHQAVQHCPSQLTQALVGVSSGLVGARQQPVVGRRAGLWRSLHLSSFVCELWVRVTFSLQVFIEL